MSHDKELRKGQRQVLILAMLEGATPRLRIAKLIDDRSTAR
jgi:hypothetical protein